MFKKNKLLCWILLILAILQVISQILGYIIRYETKNFCISILVSLGNSISENWYSFSLILFITVLGCTLYNIILDKKSEIHDHIPVIGLMLLNLLLCNKLYSTESLFKKVNYFLINKTRFIITIVFVLISIILVWMFNKAYKINKETKEMIMPDLDNEYNSESHDNDSQYIWNHPFIYLWRTYKYYFTNRKQIKYQYKNQMIKMKKDFNFQKALIKKQGKQNELEISKSKFETDAKINEAIQKKRINAIEYEDKNLKNNSNDNNSSDKNDNKKSSDKSDNSKQGLSAIILTIITIVIIVKFVKLNNFIKLFDGFKDKINFAQGWLSSIKNPIINFILVFGIILLFVILFAFLCFIIYFVYRIIIYFLFNSKEDDKRVKRFVQLIKICFFEMTDSAMRLIFFIPDFIKYVEYYLLETDLDKKIDEIFKEHENATNSQYFDKDDKKSQDQ